ncbi:hypothetical protein TCAL_10918 [Tigriopus californicus]|uniref:G-protein coupled receptors family 1 profile domain-containing protein n=1 Tax=Tigriopus californicus TaxID=6832 RepID=A0A553PQ97_TIGCA|nr:hypothetical protein TCAL_10918 [Tigriopus californicus]
MPLEVYSMWHQYPWTFGEYVCDVKTVLTEAVTCASILTVVTFTVERYLAICHPLLLATHSKAHRAFCIILGIWTFGIAYSIPWIIPTKVNYLTHPQSGASIPESAWCAIPFQDMSKAKIPLIMMIVTTLLFFVMPFIVVTTLYCRIGKSMKSSCSLTSCTCRGSVDCSVCDAEQRGHKSRKTVIRMLMTVVICFFLCWSPYHTQRLVFATLTLTGGWNTQTTYIHYYLWLASGIGYYVSCCINPLVYCVMSRRFRRGLKNVSNCMASSSNSSIATGMGSEVTSGRLFVTHHKKRRVIVHEELSDKYFSESGHREHSTPDIPTHQEPRADIAVLQ